MFWGGGGRVGVAFFVRAAVREAAARGQQRPRRHRPFILLLLPILLLLLILPILLLFLPILLLLLLLPVPVPAPEAVPACGDRKGVPAAAGTS